MKPAWSDDLCRAFAEAYDREDAAQIGEPSPWQVVDDAEREAWARERIACVRAGLDAVVRMAITEGT